MTQELNNNIGKSELNVCIKENDMYINIPNEILNEKQNLLNDYIRIYKSIENLKQDIYKYLFDKSSKISELMIVNQIFKIKKEEKISEILPFIDVDINKIEKKLKNICALFGVDEKEVDKIKEKAIQNHINSTEGLESIIEKDYVDEVINDLENGHMYSLKQRSRYGAISSEYNLKNKEDIQDFNDVEKDGQYSPILVIYRSAKYDRGTYILEDTHHVYIKRQPLNALIKQERLDEKGMDSMGAIVYKKLKYDFTNENLQELLAELYVYSQKNNLKFENIKLADITDNKIWMTADKLKKEFKELRYYHKNLTQKVKEVYDSRGSYYTQIGGKYIFNTREFLSAYKTYKGKEITNKK